MTFLTPAFLRGSRTVRRTALAVLLMAAVVGAATWVVFHSPVLGVRQVEIIGNAVVSAQTLRAAAGVPAGTPLANVDVDEVGSRVRAVTEVESARVEREWPGTLLITVVERTPVAVVPVAEPAGERSAGGSPAEGGKTNGSRTIEVYAIVDRFGVILDRVAVAPPRFPVLRVQRPDPGDPALRAALAVLEALPDDLRVNEVRVPSVRSITLKLADGRTVLWGDAGRAAEKGRALAAALAEPGTFYDVTSPRVVTIK
ncbi:cell division protein FtsQ/DivIB [Sphaerimonospora sp. CA-214678]|uniref:cell division protein FtsQ/DivIB n=1 Tax=Sphaerimonospora sp. CA-214678 TaxID=3240029 RepID=UPI003D8C4B2B